MPLPENKKKHSWKREAILGLLYSTKTHPGARWVYDQLRASIPGLSLGTVYRNIREFHQEGKAVSLGVVRGEERFDGRTESHPHAVCTHCGKIEDLGEETLAELERFQMKIPGFSINMRNIIFYGICDDCQSAVCDRETTALGR